jgi:plasmid replication initiation protein
MAKGEIVKPREIVKAHNELFRARHKIKDVLAGRIFMAFASLVDENALSKDGVFLEYQIPASSILIENRGGDNYKQLKDAANSLVGHKIEKKLKKNNFAVYALFSAIKYEDGMLFGRFDKDLKPFFIAAKGAFTRINFNDFMKLPSIYSQRIFGFLKSWDDIPEIEISLADLHEMFDAPESFRSDFRQFRTRVLEKAHKDITGLTSMRYEWEPIKKGRTVVAIRFIFSKKRALPVLKQKENNTRQKIVDKNNDIGKAAVNCSNKKNGHCTKQDNKPDVCKYCIQFGVCKEIALNLL